MNFERRLYRTARLCLWRPRKRCFACGVEVGSLEGCAEELYEIVLVECFDAFRRAHLTGDKPACVVSMRVTVKQGADLT